MGALDLYISERFPEKYGKKTIEQVNAIDKIITAKYINDACVNHFKFEFKFKEGGNESVLYILCEDGSYFVECVKPIFPPSIKYFVAVDSSMENIDEAESTFKGVNFRVLDIEKTDLEWDEKYHYIMSFWKMHVVKDRLQTFKNIYYLLENGGYVYLVYTIDSLFIKAFRRMLAKKQWSVFLKNNAHFHYLSPSQSHDIVDIHANFKEAGFVNVKIERTKITDLFKTEEEYREKLDCLNIFRNKIPIEQRNLFYSAFLEEIKTESSLVFGDYSSSKIFLAVDNVIMKMVAFKPKGELYGLNLIELDNCDIQ